MRKHIPILLLLALASLLTATPLKDEFETRIRATETSATGLPIILEYSVKMTDLDDLRVLQNYWMQADPEGCRSHFAKLHEEDPQSPINHYLWLRNSDQPAQQIAGGRQIVSLNPDFYWGYRLFSSVYAQVLQDPETAPALREDIRANLAEDLSLLQNGLQRFPGDEYLLLALFHYYSAQEDYAGAESYLLRLRDPNAVKANFRQVMDFVAKSKRVRGFEALFPKYISAEIAGGNMNPQDSLEVYQQTYLYALTLAEDWTRLSEYLDLHKHLKEQDATLETRIAMNLGLKNFETALNLLEGGMAAEVLDVNEAVDNPAYAPLRDLPRWDGVIANARRIREQGRQARKDKTLATKISKPAPLWELPDAEGNLVRLEDQRGKIVILDFWATWCNPCLKTMPVLDRWLKDHPSADLEIFSINTWDNQVSRDQVISFMRDRGYAMTLLIGNNELPKAYGFSGIPYICVIDPAGKIAFEHTGYSKDLDELLDFWSEALRD